MKINIAGFNPKKSKINLDFDVNTSAEVGNIQPVMCEEVIPHASYDLSCNSMVQVAPLLSPLFGRLSLRQYTRFVPMKDVFHHFDEVLGKRKVTHGSATNLVSQVPTMTYTDLMKILIHQQSVVTGWYFPLHGKAIPDTSVREHTDVLQWVAGASSMNDVHICQPTSQYNIPSYSSTTDNDFIYLQNGASTTDGTNYTFNYIAYNSQAVDPNNVYMDVNPFFVQAYGSMPTPEDADFVVYKQTTSNNYNIATCIRLSQRGRNLLKVFNGLGLKVNMDTLYGKYSDLASQQFSILPFLAFYKAWFDQMYPKRTVNFANTYAGKLISMFDANSLSANISRGGTYWANIIGFFNDLSTMSYVFENDYFTAHLSSLGSSTEDGTFSPGDGIFDSVESNSSQVTKINSDNAAFSTAGLKLLAAVNNAVLSGTYIGKRVNDYLRQYGVVQNDEESSLISSNILDIQTGTVLSTTENDNLFLGQKGGQAEGRSSGNNKPDNWKFTPTVHGYLIKFIAIVPKSGFSQGISPIFSHKTRYHFFNQSFDGVGYRLTPGFEFYAENLCAMAHPDYSNTYIQNCGFIGRYSEYKYKTNLANGDFIRRPTKKSIGSYYLDKRLPESDFYYLSAPWSDALYPNSKIYRPVVSTSNPPVPTEAVRFCKNENFDYNRIFVNRDEIENNRYLKRFFDPVDDHFIIHQVNDYKCFAPCLPISDSQGTSDFVDESQQSVKDIEMS